MKLLIRFLTFLFCDKTKNVELQTGHCVAESAFCACVVGCGENILKLGASVISQK